NQSEQIAGADWVLQGIKAFIKDYHPPENGNRQSDRFTAGQISDWCISQEEFQDNDILSSSHRLGRYMSERSSTLAQVLHVHYIGITGNRATYRYIPPR